MTIDVAAADELLTTTRSVKRRLDRERPVPRALVLECIEVALQAPSAGNRQQAGFVVVDDAGTRAALAEIYREAHRAYHVASADEYEPGDPRGEAAARVAESGRILLEHLHEVPVLVVPVIAARPEGKPPGALAAMYGSILPAVWSFALAARARGLGTTWTTLHLRREAEAAALLGIPPTHAQVAMLPVAYVTGDGFRQAPRLGVADVAHLNRWGTAP
jgi:nitroreductase